MKHKRAFSLAALSVTALLSTLCAQPVPEYVDVDSPCSMSCWEATEECVDHPLYPVQRPHLLTVGGDFLTAHARRNENLKHRWVYMPGAHVGYDYLHPDTIYVGLRGEVGWFQEKASHQIIEKPSLVEARLGYNLSYAGNCGYALVSPYIGFGAASSKVRFDRSSHVRASYFCLGVRSRYALCSSWSIGCDAQAFRTLSLHHHAVLPKVDGKHPKNLKTKLDNRWTGEVALPVTYYAGCQKQWSIECAPYATWFTLSTIRPAYGARVTLGYRF